MTLIFPILNRPIIVESLPDASNWQFVESLSLSMLSMAVVIPCNMQGYITTVHGIQSSTWITIANAVNQWYFVLLHNTPLPPQSTNAHRIALHYSHPIQFLNFDILLRSKSYEWIRVYDSIRWSSTCLNDSNVRFKYGNTCGNLLIMGGLQSLNNIIFCVMIKKQPKSQILQKK